jgi:hypothetical protein
MQESSAFAQVAGTWPRTVVTLVFSSRCTLSNALFRVWTRGVQRREAVAIDLGKQLLAAKAACAHGEFGRLFSDHARPVEGALSFNRFWATRVMRIAEHSVIANVQHAAQLPADLQTVYELATMTAPALEAAIESGKVTPSTTRAEAKEIKREAEPEPAKPAKPKGATDGEDEKVAKKSRKQSAAATVTLPAMMSGSTDGFALAASATLRSFRSLTFISAATAARVSILAALFGGASSLSDTLSDKLLTAFFG